MAGENVVLQKGRNEVIVVLGGLGYYVSHNNRYLKEHIQRVQAYGWDYSKRKKEFIDRGFKPVLPGLFLKGKL